MWRAARRRSGSVRCWCGCGAGRVGAALSAAAIASASASSPRLRTATVGITGTPSACASAAGSSTSPSRSARSTMLSATTIGRPSSISSCANTRCCSRLAASSTITSTSGGASPGNSPRIDLAGHFLVGAGGVERVAAGQVDQLDRLAARQDQPPRLALDGDARIVGDLLPRAGQRVEQRALARIGIADQRGGAQAAS